MEWSSSKNFKEFTLIPSQRAHQTKLRFPRSYFQEFLKNNLSLSLQRLLTASKLRSFDRFVPLRVVGTTKRPRRERGVGVSYARLCEGEGSRLNEANSPSFGLVFPSLFPLFSVSLDSCVPSLRVSSSRIRWWARPRARNRFWKDEEREKLNGYRTKKHAVQRLRTYGLPLI